MASVSSIGLYSTARGNLLGAGHIFRVLPAQERDINPCIQFLLAFAVEGYFKALLAQKNYTEKQLRGIGHNLRAAMQEVEDVGVILPQRSKLGFVVNNLAEGHSKLQYRYLGETNTGGVTMVYPRVAFAVLVPLDETVFGVVQADVNEEELQLGLPITSAWQGVPLL